MRSVKAIEILYKVGNLYPHRIIIPNKSNYFNPDDSFTMIENNQKIILKKSLFKIKYLRWRNTTK